MRAIVKSVVSDGVIIHVPLDPHPGPLEVILSWEQFDNLYLDMSNVVAKYDREIPGVEAAAETLIGLDHTDDYIRGFGAEMHELQEWERNSARQAAGEILKAARSSR